MMLFQVRDLVWRDVLTVSSLDIEASTVTKISGVSGSGKSSLLKLLCGVYEPTSGHIRYRGHDLRDMSLIEYRQKVVLMSQNPVMFAGRLGSPGTLDEELSVGFTVRGQNPPDKAARLQSLDDVGLAKSLESPSSVLSGGERQRLALARVMLLQPETLLLDEPTAALDIDSARMVMQMVMNQAGSAGRSVVVVSHDQATAGLIDRHVELGPVA